MMRRLARVVLVSITLWACLGAAAVDNEGAADIAATVEQLRSALRDLTASGATVEPARVIAVVDQVVVPHIDLNLAAQLVMGRYWRDASAEQRSAFIDVYRSLLLHLYAVNALDYVDAKVDFLTTQQSEDGQQQRVSTRVHRAGRPDTTVDYQLRKRDGQWRVFDAVVNGVSVVITLRTAVGEDLARYGIDGVIARLRAKFDASAAAH